MTVENESKPAQPAPAPATPLARARRSVDGVAKATANMQQRLAEGFVPPQDVVNYDAVQRSSIEWAKVNAFVSIAESLHTIAERMPRGQA